MLSNRQYWLSFAQTAGSSFNAARAEGVDAAKATAYAAVNGLLGAIVEIGGGGIQSLPSELKQSPSQLKVWLDGLIDEGQEEIVQGVIDRLAQNVTYQAGNPIVSLSDENAVFNPITAAKEGAMGAAVGGIVGGGQILANNAINSIAQRRAQRDLDAFLEAAGIDTQAQPEAVVAPESAPIQEQAQTVAPESQPVQEVVQESPVAPESAPIQEPPVEYTPVAGGTQSTAQDTRTVVSKLRDSIPALRNSGLVAQLTGSEFSKGSKKLSEQVSDFFRSLGNRVLRHNFGEVIIDNRSIKDDMAHGIGRAKAVAFAAVPNVIKDGQQIDYQPNWKGRGYDTYIFAAPVDIGGQRSYVAAVVRSDSANRFYLHEVVDGDGNQIYVKKESAPDNIKTGVTAQGGVTGGPGTLSSNIIADANQNINPESSVGAAPAGFADPESVHPLKLCSPTKSNFGVDIQACIVLSCRQARGAAVSNTLPQRR